MQQEGERLETPPEQSEGGGNAYVSDGVRCVCLLTTSNFKRGGGGGGSNLPHLKECLKNSGYLKFNNHVTCKTVKGEKMCIGGGGGIV
jgi:hypothetical protein